MPGSIRLHRVLTAKPENVYKAFLDAGPTGPLLKFCGGSRNGRCLGGRDYRGSRGAGGILRSKVDFIQVQ